MPSKSALLLGVSTLAAFTLSPVLAQQAGLQGAAEREIHRRELVTNYVQEVLSKGNAALASKDYESAYAYFKNAVDALPSGGSATTALRSQAMSGFGTAVIALAKQRISEGRYEDAETVVEVILQEQYDPGYKPALALQSELQNKKNPAFNPTITPSFVASVEQVKSLLREGEGFYQSGRYDLAFKRCEQVLNIDRTNIAARRLMEKIDGARDDYSESAKNYTRNKLITDVDAAWELPVTPFDLNSSQIIEQPTLSTRGTASIQRKLEDIRIPKINFHEATVREALEFIKLRSQQLDTSEPDENKRGINIVLKPDPANQAAADTRITLELTDVALDQALKYIADAANLKMKVEPYAVAIVPIDTQTDVLITKEYKVSPGFISSLPAASTESGAAGGGVAAGGTTGGFGLPPAAGGTPTAGKSSAKDVLEAAGVTFPPGASANYLSSSGKLIVRNTQLNLDLVDRLVENDQTILPTQVQIESKFVEITQNNLKELGFDWLLGQFQIGPGGSGIYGGGGTTPFGSNLPGTITSTSSAGASAGGAGGSTITTNNVYPFQAPDSNGVPVGASSLTSGPLGYNRTGEAAVKVNAIDGLLFGAPTGPAAGVLAVAGIFTNPQFQVVIRALDQQKGIDLMSAPKITAKSGQQATISIIREFIYPTAYDPPQIPQTVDTGFSPVTPTTPTSFEMRPLGVELEVLPNVGPDGNTIDLTLSPRVTEFDGFINYGSPIYTSAQSITTGILDPGGIVGGLLNTVVGPPTQVLISQNVINQPIFSVRQVTTQVTLYDGQTVVLGGLMREDVQKVEDKTPIIGDIPLVGRLFRTSADQHIKRNLIMFVTANLIDPAGQPLIRAVEDENDVLVPDAAALGSEAIPGDSTSGTPLPGPSN